MKNKNSYGKFCHIGKKYILTYIKSKVICPDVNCILFCI